MARWIPPEDSYCNWIVYVIGAVQYECGRLRFKAIQENFVTGTRVISHLPEAQLYKGGRLGIYVLNLN